MNRALDNKAEEQEALFGTDEMEANEAMENLQRNLAGGYSRFATSNFVDSHRLTGNWSNGPLMTKPPVYKPLPRLPPVKFGQR